MKTQSMEVDEGFNPKFRLLSEILFAILGRGPRAFQIEKINVVNP